MSFIYFLLSGVIFNATKSMAWVKVFSRGRTQTTHSSIESNHGRAHNKANQRVCDAANRGGTLFPVVSPIGAGGACLRRGGRISKEYERNGSQGKTACPGS
jgi:hypothetical protein